MNNKCKIVVAGSFIVDITGFSPRFPKDGETVLGSTIKTGPGGKGSNQATAAARAGAEVIMIAKIGSDVLSGIAHQHYSAEGMSEKFIYTTTEADTGSAFIEVNETTGENRIIVIKGANELLSEADICAAESEIASASVVLTQLETNDNAVEVLLRCAKKHGKTTIVNPAPFQEVKKGLFDGVDYFTPNETEAEYFSGIKVETEEDAKKAADKMIHELGVRNVIITLGKKGAFFTDGTSQILVPSATVKAVDTTGAGDAFNGGLAVALSEGMDIETALKFANATAAISVTRRGASPSMPQRAEIDELKKSFYEQN